MSTSGPEIKKLLLALLPPGAFAEAVDIDGADTLVGDWFEMDSEALGEAQDVADQLLLEIFPHTAEQTLDEWAEMLELAIPGATSQADKQLLCKAAASSAAAITPHNLRGMLADFFNSQYGFWDHGTSDVLSHYDEVQEGTGVVGEGASGLTTSGTSPAHLDFEAGDDAHAQHNLVDRGDAWQFTAELQSGYTVNQDTAVCIYVRDGANAVFCGVEDVSGTTRARARLLQDGNWTDLGDVAAPAAPLTLKILRDGDGRLNFLVDSTEIAINQEVAWLPRSWGVCARNDAVGRTVSGTWQDIRIAYDRGFNNVEIHEKKIGEIPSTEQWAIFRAFVHRDPLDSGSYQLAEPQKICDRVKWGHTIIIVGESDSFLTDDEYSLTDRDILGV
jgi:hypothetical protein